MPRIKVLTGDARTVLFVLYYFKKYGEMNTASFAKIANLKESVASSHCSHLYLDYTHPRLLARKKVITKRRGLGVGSHSHYVYSITDEGLLAFEPFAHLVEVSDDIPSKEVS